MVDFSSEQLVCNFCESVRLKVGSYQSSVGRHFSSRFVQEFVSSGNNTGGVT